MNALRNTYRTSLALLTDLYQLTMAYGYWKLKRQDEHAVFHLFFRRTPFQGGYAIAAGLEPVMELLESMRFEEDDVAYLATITGNDGKPLFEHGFLDHLRSWRFTCDVDAIPEGTVVFAQEPLLRVTGPILQAQILETALLNIVNFQTLVATKASRVCAAAMGEPVLEFGLRRAQGIDGALAASRAAHIGGCASTSNVLAGKLFGIPVKGTHAHSWVMSFDDELEAFDAYAQAMPNNCVFLVDTYDTLEGVRRAAEVGKRLRQRGHEMVGIRLDSGDLAYLSIEARKILDAAGFPNAAIVASNDLDENIIASLKQQGAAIGVWGVGTKLVTAYDQAALGGVYKLGAIRETPDSPWRSRIKVSEQAIKTTTPGILQVRRFREGGRFIADMIYDETFSEAGKPAAPAAIVDPNDATRHKPIPATASGDNLLVPVFRAGQRVYESPALANVRTRTNEQLALLHPSIRRPMNPHEYPVGLEPGLHATKMAMIAKVRGEQA